MAPDDRTILSEKQDRSEIAEFYRGRIIFITGGTGFLGKVLVETLLRCCPDVKKMLLLCRPKKDKSIEERMAQQLSDPLYDYIKKTNPEVLSKLVPIAGDSLKPNLGMNEEDLKTLVNETNVIIHMAATVRFDESLRQAVPINVRSTRDILFLARRMTNLSAFVYVSTAYSNCVHKDIDEKFYKPPIDGDCLIEMAEGLDDDLLLRITPGLLGDYPNTYTFTKCVAEDLVRKYSAGLPIAMTRPSIVMPVYKGPCPGWTDNINGPTGLGIGLFVGIIHLLQAGKDIHADMIPVDFVINGILAAAWNVGTKTPTLSSSGTSLDKICELKQAKVEESSVEDGREVEIYNSVASDNRITWGAIVDYIIVKTLADPSQNMMWKPFCILIENYYVFEICAWVFHWIPAYIVDALLKLLGQKPILVKIYVKAEKFRSSLTYFATNEWNFGTAKMRNLIEKLSDADKATFPIDVEQLSWKEFLYISLVGARKYILKETMVPAGRTKLLLLTIAHLMLCALLLFVFYKFLNRCFIEYNLYI